MATTTLAQASYLAGDELAQLSAYGRLVMAKDLTEIQAAAKQLPGAPNVLFTDMFPSPQGNAQQTKVRVVLLAGGEVVLIWRGPASVEVDNDKSLRLPTSELKGLQASWGSWMGSWFTSKPDPEEVPQVHRNFLEEANEVLTARSALKMDLTTFIKNAAFTKMLRISKITCIGHGVGGAVATIGAFWCAKVGFTKDSIPISCATFGSPFVGNSAFAAEFNAVVQGPKYRIIHKSDPLPTVPEHTNPKDKTKSLFKHVEAPVLVYEPQVNSLGLSAELLAAAPSGYVAERRAQPLPWFNYELADHDIGSYVDGLDACQGKPTGASSRAPNTNAFEKLFYNLQETGDSEQVSLMPKANLEQCFKYAHIAVAAYDDDFDVIEARFARVDPEYREKILDMVMLKADGDLWGNSITTDTEALVLVLNSGEAIVGFRGTETERGHGLWDDVFTDISVALIRPDAIDSMPNELEDDGSLVHRGFATGLEDLVRSKIAKRSAHAVTGEVVEGVGRLDEVILFLGARHKVAINKITCCGHSLGGALATMGAYWFKKAANPLLRELPVNCVTFGSPRVGNKKFTENWNDLTGSFCYRFMHKGDSVTMVPPQLTAARYNHVDDPVLLIQPKMGPKDKRDGVDSYGAEPGKGVEPIPPPPADKAGDKGFMKYYGYQAQLRHRPSGLYSLVMGAGDHSMVLYFEAINSALGRPPMRLVDDPVKGKGDSKAKAQTASTGAATGAPGKPARAEMQNPAVGDTLDVRDQ